MGAPRRNRKKYDKPKDMWNLARINSDNSMIEEFGLKNMRELWKVQTQLSNMRSNVRLMLSTATPGTMMMREKMLGRLSRYGIAPQGSTLDNILDLKENAFLARRLQSLVFRKGLAKTTRQARQLIVHGFISINGRRVNRPGYLVSVDEEKHIGYYKPIDIGAKPKVEESKEAGEKTE